MNKFCILLIILGTLSLNCFSQDTVMTKQEFTKRIFDSIAKKLPNVEIKTLSEGIIELTTPYKTIIFVIGFTYREYLIKKRSTTELINDEVENVCSLFLTEEPLRLNQIMPCIQPVEFIKSQNKFTDTIKSRLNLSGPDGDFVYDKYNDQLIIVYGVSKNNSFDYLDHKDLMRLSISQDTLKQFALKNLEVYLEDRIKYKCLKKDKVYMLTAGGFFEATLIMMEGVFNKDSIPVKGDFVVGIPNSDILVVTGSDNTEDVSFLRVKANEFYLKNSAKISPYLYKWNGKIFIKFD